MLSQWATCVAQKKDLFWKEVKVGYFGYVIVNFGFTFFIITLKVNICLKKLKTLQNFMLLCKYV